ncbi:hypothetical protein QR680_017076 [Steinernema hermaphroditum]|uniref:Uncharacterized protein n=1 Tax=Steinernema hermaphroditum TaxID=289476 RepID=A0AA39HD84_9BILA|nr:hypothetical protein QR680_017076 [Steinernema hermaphroditum]
MSSSNINLSLDDIIKQNKAKKPKGGANRQGKRQGAQKKFGKGVKQGRITKERKEPEQRAHPLDPFSDDTPKQKPKLNKKHVQKSPVGGAGGSVQQRLSAIKKNLQQNRGGQKSFKPRFRK